MKSDAPNNMQRVSRALLDVEPGEYVLTSDIAANADMLDKASHVSAMLNNLRTRSFIESQKGSTGGNEQEHRVVEANRDKFVAWLDRDTVKPPTNDPTTKGRATNKSASAHRIDVATRKPMSLSQLASAAESGTLPPHEDDEAADAKRAGKLSIREFYARLSEVLGIPPTWQRVCITAANNTMPLIVCDLEPPAIVLGIGKP